MKKLQIFGLLIAVLLFASPSPGADDAAFAIDYNSSIEKAVKDSGGKLDIISIRKLMQQAGLGGVKVEHAMVQALLRKFPEQASFIGIHAIACCSKEAQSDIFKTIVAHSPSTAGSLKKAIQKVEAKKKELKKQKRFAARPLYEKTVNKKKKLRNLSKKSSGKNKKLNRKVTDDFVDNKVFSENSLSNIRTTIIGGGVSRAVELNENRASP